MRTNALRALLLTVASVTSVFAEDDWTGKTVITKHDNVKIGHTDDQGQPVYTADLKWLQYKVRRDKGAWVQIAQNDQEDWAPKSDFVPLNEASAYFSERIRETPTAAGLWNRRGSVYQIQGQLDLAIKDFDEGLRLNPSAAGHISRGACWFDKKEYDRAIRDFNEAIQLDPKFVEGFVNRGKTWFVKSDYDRALRDYDEALRINPKHVEALNNRGVVWTARKEFDRAIRDFDEAIKLDPKYALAFFNRGNAEAGK